MSNFVIVNATKQPMRLFARVGGLPRPFDLGAGKQAPLPNDWPPDIKLRFIEQHEKHYGMKKISEVQKFSAHDGIFYIEKPVRDGQIIEAIKERDNARDEEARELIAQTAVAFDEAMSSLGPDADNPVGARETALEVMTEVAPEDKLPENALKHSFQPDRSKKRRR
jgi:hypothetical protein